LLLRVVRVGLACLVLLYGMFLAGMVAAQRMFVFDVRDTGGHLDEPGTLAIEGSTRVTIPTKDGEKLAGWYLPPREKDAITFLFFHGKGGGLERKKERWKKIAEHGAGVLAFSYRGFPGSSGSPSEAGLYEDARAAFNWLSKRQSPDKIVLHGLSLGTGVAAKLASEVKARALILEAPFTALVDVAGDRHPYLPVSFLLWDRFATRDVISDAKMPVLIANGDADKAIPIAHAEELFELAPEPKAFVTFPGGGHETLVRDGLYQHIWRFIGDLSET
jgi:uncharacterized protein